MILAQQSPDLAKTKDRMMEPVIHELQKYSAALLWSLYVDKRLRVTPAMAAIFNRAYPTLEQIIATLDYYRNIDIVETFLRDHALLIDAVRTEIEIATAKAPPRDGEVDADGGFGDSSIAIDVESTDLFSRRLKDISIRQLEVAFAAALSELATEPYQIEIQRLDFEAESNAWLHDAASIELIVSKKVKNFS